LFTAPVYRPPSHTVELTVSNFFFTNPTTRQQSPLDVYLGNLGPLPLRIFQSPSAGPLTSVNSFIASNQPLDGRDDAPSSPGMHGVRYGAAPLHTVVMAELPPLADVIKALEDDALPTPHLSANGNKQSQSENAEGSSAPPPPLPIPSIAGRSLPLLFIRPTDGVGYHSGRTITCENVFQTMELGGIAGHQVNGPSGSVDANWIAAAQAAAAADGTHGWTLRVM